MYKPEKTFFIADTHFGDFGIAKYQSRFASSKEMDDAIIHNWNKKVGKEDHIFIVGDMVSGDRVDPAYYLKRLRGRKHLIIGNHDMNLIHKRSLSQYFESIDSIKVIGLTSGEKIWMSHYPMADWPDWRKGTYHLYGHIHATGNELASNYMKEYDRAFNVGAMVIGYTPVTLRELTGEAESPDFDTVSYKGKEYVIRNIEIPGYGNQTLSVHSLNEIMNDGEYPDDEAKQIDERIFFYIPDKMIKKRKDEIKEYLAKYLQ